MLLYLLCKCLYLLRTEEDIGSPRSAVAGGFEA